MQKNRIKFAVISALVVVGALIVPPSASAQQAETAVKTSSSLGWNLCSFDTYYTGVPNKCFYQSYQGFVLQRWGYRGSIDGVLGAESWKATQRLLNAMGYNAGTVDGIPGVQTKKAMQRFLANNAHYQGAIDGVFGAQTYKAMALYILSSMN